MSLNLIEKAIQYAREERLKELSDTSRIYYGLFPEAFHGTFYLRVRQSIQKGCRKAVKLIPNPLMRTIVFSVLMKCLEDLFHYGYREEIVEYYNSLLDSLIGTH